MLGVQNAGGVENADPGGGGGDSKNPNPKGSKPVALKFRVKGGGGDYYCGWDYIPYSQWMASKELPKGWKYKFPYLLVLQNHHPRGEGYNPRSVGTGQPVMSVSCTSGRHLELDWERAGLAVPTTEITGQPRLL